MRLFVFVTTVVALAACGGSSGDTSAGPGGNTGGSGNGADSVVASVAVTPSPLTLYVGQTSTLSATPRNASNTLVTGRTVTWTASDTSIVTVSSTGLVRARTVGTATITATVDAKTGSTSITVASVPVASVSVVPSSASIAVGATVTFAATAADSAGNVLIGRDIAWSSSDTAVASVATTGIVTGRKAGSCTIIASSSGKSATGNVTVTGPSPGAYLVAPSVLVKFAGDTAQLTASDSSGTAVGAGSVVWSSSNPSVGSVSTTGIVRALAPGTTTISASIGAAVVLTVLTVTTQPATLSDVLAHYPIAMRQGSITVSTDISTAFTAAHAANLDATWRYYAAFFGATPGSHLELYYTRDSSVYVRVGSFCPNNVWYINARQVSSCYTSADGSWKEFIIPYIIPDFGTQYHEVSHLFLQKVHPDDENFPWLKEGSGMYFESGTFDANNQLVVTTPAAYIRDGFHRHDRANDLTPIDTLIRMGRSTFYAGLYAGDGERNYSQAGMFFTYLMLTQRPVMNAMFAAFAQGQLPTNADVIQFITAQTGMTIPQLEQGYLAYGRSLP